MNTVKNYLTELTKSFPDVDYLVNKILDECENQARLGKEMYALSVPALNLKTCLSIVDILTLEPFALDVSYNTNTLTLTIKW